MSIVTFVLGESGSGKTTSLRHFDPAKTLLIQTIPKPLSFRMPGWARLSPDTPRGNMFVLDDSEKIIKTMRKTARKVIIVDDFQYLMANEFMLRSNETGYQKFTDIGRHAWDVITAASTLGPDVRVYFLAHTQTDEAGTIRVKTVGRMLDEKISIEGMVTIVLRTSAHGGNYEFLTHNSGNDTVKTIDISCQSS
jgi:hypothetical protein